MDASKKKIIGLSLVVLLAIIALGVMASRTMGPGATGEGVVDYKVQPPPDTAPLGATEGAGGPRETE